MSSKIIRKDSANESFLSSINFKIVFIFSSLFFINSSTGVVSNFPISDNAISSKIIELKFLLINSSFSKFMGGG